MAILPKSSFTPNAGYLMFIILVFTLHSTSPFTDLHIDYIRIAVLLSQIVTEFFRLA